MAIYRIWIEDSNDRQEAGRLEVPDELNDEFLSKPFDALVDADFFLWDKKTFEEENVSVDVGYADEDVVYITFNEPHRTWYVQLERDDGVSPDFKLITGENLRYKWEG